MENVFQKATESAMYIRSLIPEMPEVAIILGSGLGNLVHEIRDKIEIPYINIPNFKSSNVVGHDNKLIYGTIYGKSVIAMSGRYHYYEGYSMEEVAFPVKVFSLLGVANLIVSTACGAINKKFKAGDLMLITDHIKFLADSPLRGPNIDEFGARFPDMSEAYSKHLIEVAKASAKKLQIDIQEGVFGYMPGPQYETPAEVKMLGILGVDAVSMSTVPEVISAVHCGIDVLGISCITNATGNNQKLSHSEVIEVANQCSQKFVNLVMEIINRI